MPKSTPKHGMVDLRRGGGGKDELFKGEFQCSPEVGRMLSYG